MNVDNLPLVSVIVPVYNTELYLKKCLKSLLQQTYSNYEIIIINDGSNDESLNIINKFIIDNTRIRLFNQTNQGIAVTRNNGISYASGELIMFVDSDDFVKSNYISEAVKTMIKFNSDLVCFGYTKLNSDGTEKEYLKYSSSHNLSHDEAMSILIKDSYLWDKLFKKSLFTGISFPDGKTYEDNFTNYKLFRRASRISYLADSTQYIYVNRDNSIVNSKTSKNIANAFRSSLELYELFKEKYPNVAMEMKPELIARAITYSTYVKYGTYPHLDNKATNLLKTNPIPVEFDLVHRLSMQLFKISAPLARVIFKLKSI